MADTTDLFRSFRTDCQKILNDVGEREKILFPDLAKFEEGRFPGGEDYRHKLLTNNPIWKEFRVQQADFVIEGLKDAIRHLERRLEQRK